MTIGDSNELAPKPAPALNAHVNRGLFYHHDEEEEQFVYRDSSLPISSHYSSNVGDARSRTGLITSRGSDSSPSNPGNRSLGLLAKGDDEVDDQQSTEPVPADFDHRAMFISSSPPDTRPMTRARARAQALDQTENDSLVGSTHDIEALKSGADNDEYQLLPHFPCRDSPISRARLRAPPRSIDGFDGSAEERSSIDAEGSASPALESERSGSNPGDDDDDDEYRVPESENENDDSEASVIADIIGHPKRKPNKKPTKTANLSRPRNKQAAKIGAGPIATNKNGGSLTNNAPGSSHRYPAVPNQFVDSADGKNMSLDKLAPVFHQNAKASAGSGDQKALDAIPDSQGAPQELAASPTAKSKGSNNRRPKKPFYPDNLGGHQTKPQGASCIYSDTNIHQQLIAHQGGVNSSSPDKTESLESKATRATNQSRRIALDILPSEAKQERGNNGVNPLVSKGKCLPIGHNQPTVTINRVSNSPILLSSDQHSRSTDMDYGRIHSQNPPPHGTGAENSKRPSNSEASKRPAKKAKAAPKIERSCDNIDASTQDHLPQSSPSPPYYYRMRDTTNEVPQAKIVETKPLLPNIYHQMLQRKEAALGDNTTKYQFLKSPQVHDTSGSSRSELTTARAKNEFQRAENPEPLPSVEAYRNYSDTEESLHPNSRAWAQKIAERSRKKNLTSMPEAMMEEIETLSQTPITARESGKNPISKREITLAGRREAIFESIQEVTIVSVNTSVFVSHYSLTNNRLCSDICNPKSLP